MAEKTLAIVGAGPGLGLAIGRKFGEQGFRVALIARSKERVEGLAGQLRASGIEAAGFVADATHEAGLAAAFQAARAKFGPIDVLEFSPMPPPTTEANRSAEGTTVEVAEALLRLQVLGAIASVRQVLPEMLGRRSGTILLTTGLSASVPMHFITPISAAMAAARQYALCLNSALAAQGVFAATISIGVFIGSGQPGSDPADLAAAYYRLYEERDRAELIILPPSESGDLKDKFKDL